MYYYTEKQKENLAFLQQHVTEEEYKWIMTYFAGTHITLPRDTDCVRRSVLRERLSVETLVRLSAAVGKRRYYISIPHNAEVRQLQQQIIQKVHAGVPLNEAMLGIDISEVAVRRRLTAQEKLKQKPKVHAHPYPWITTLNIVGVDNAARLQKLYPNKYFYIPSDWDKSSAKVSFLSEDIRNQLTATLGGTAVWVPKGETKDMNTSIKEKAKVL